MTPNEDAVVTETSTARSWLEEDGVIRHVIRAGTELELTAARENLQIVIELVAGAKKPMVADLSQLASASREVRELYAGSEAADVVRCVAIVLGSPVSCIIGNFYMAISRPIYPTRLFTKHEAAVGWAREHLG